MVTRCAAEWRAGNCAPWLLWTPRPFSQGDVVLCKVYGREFLHLVKAVQDGRFQIGNNKGHVNGWVGANGIYGKLVAVED
jgi:hypothetical protein